MFIQYHLRLRIRLRTSPFSMKIAVYSMKKENEISVVRRLFGKCLPAGTKCDTSPWTNITAQTATNANTNNLPNEFMIQQRSIDITVFSRNLKQKKKIVVAKTNAQANTFSAMLFVKNYRVHINMHSNL